jgi:hypothetical protein
LHQCTRAAVHFRKKTIFSILLAGKNDGLDNLEDVEILAVGGSFIKGKQTENQSLKYAGNTPTLDVNNSI